MGSHYSDPIYPKARKAHRCVACGWEIAAGEVYTQQSGHFDGRAFRNRFHRECFDALCEESDTFEFIPGDLDPPERLVQQQEPSP